MTQAFCKLVLHFSTARLSWATIKSLHRQRIKFDDVTPIEYEILMGWTLLAMHSIYVSSGIEYPLSFLIPFYYYFKLLVLGATFILPSLSALNPLQNLTGGSSGSNPFIVGWFHYLIVPGVQRMHEMIDHDPKRWAVELLTILPFFILDYFILPGVLLSDEEREAVRMRRREVQSVMKDAPILSAPPASMFERDDMIPMKPNNEQRFKDDSEEDECSNELDDTLNPIDKYSDGQTESNLYHSPIRQHRIASLDTPEHAATTSFFPLTTPASTSFASNLYETSPLAKSRVASSTLKLRRFSREHKVGQTPPPTVKLTPRVHEPTAAEDTTDNTDNVYTEHTASTKKETKPKSRHRASDENETPNHVETTNSKRSRRERKSLGDHFREIVTGDANIRVRDHLFDLDLPSVPICPSPRHHSPPSYRVTRSKREARQAVYEGSRSSEVDPSNITTRSRRSSRNRPDYTEY